MISGPEALPSEAKDDPEGVAAVVDIDEDVCLHSLEFSTELAPQDIKVRIRIFGMEGKDEKNVKIDITPGTSEREFHWDN